MTRGMEMKQGTAYPTPVRSHAPDVSGLIRKSLRARPYASPTEISEWLAQHGNPQFAADRSVLERTYGFVTCSEVAEHF